MKFVVCWWDDNGVFFSVLKAALLMSICCWGDNGVFFLYLRLLFSCLFCLCSWCSEYRNS